MKGPEPRRRYYDLPNLLSLSRLVLTLPIILLILSPWPEGYFVGGWLFLLAVLTDTLDGYLARRQSSGASSLGIYLDLVADKVLVLALLGVLVNLGLVPLWMALTIAAREVVVMGLRWGAASKGRVIPAAGWGKGKTVITSIGIAAVILGESLGRGAWAQAANLGGWLDLVASISSPLMAAATLLTLVSGAFYVRLSLPIVLGTAPPQPPLSQGGPPNREALP